MSPLQTSNESPCCIAGGMSPLPLPWTDEAHAESDAKPEPCMGTVTRVDVDDMGQVFWLITSVESEIADVVVFGKDLQRAGITEGIQVGGFCELPEGQLPHGVRAEAQACDRPHRVPAVNPGTPASPRAHCMESVSPGVWRSHSWGNDT